MAATANAAEPALAIELDVDPASVTRLLRHPAVLASRTGRIRTVAEERIWLDTANGLLAANGLSLEAPRRAAQRLLQVLPPAGHPWQPGTPDRACDDPAILHRAVTGPAIPIAAFSGRASTLRLAGAAQGIDLAVRAGKLRAVAAERTAARLTLTGPAGPLLDLAARLIADLPVGLARAPLAEEGRALARGEAPRARRSGPPALGKAESVEAALEVAIGHLIEAMLHQAPECRLEAGPTGVHQLRVALRRLRSVLQAFRPAARCDAVARFDDGLKGLARRLGPARDLDVFLSGLGAALGAALPDDRRVANLLRAATTRRIAAYAALRQSLDGPEFRSLAFAGAALLVRRPWRDAALDVPAQGETLAAPLPAFGAELLDKRWQRLRAGAEDIRDKSDAALHALRLEAKRLRYGAELFAPLWPGKPARRFVKRLAALQEALGLSNDVAVARALVGELGGVPAWAVGVAEGFAVAQAVGARARSLAAWDTFEAAKPFWRAG